MGKTALSYNSDFIRHIETGTITKKVSLTCTVVSFYSFPTKDFQLLLLLTLVGE